METVESVNVLGRDYKIIFCNYEDKEYFKENNADGYCDFLEGEIMICKLHTFPGWEKESDQYCSIQMRQTLRHEIVHAFLYESGLHSNSNNVDQWATNEEMVDWIALQGLKIYNAWVKAKAV